jgi:hypothetical protein
MQQPSPMISDGNTYTLIRQQRRSQKVVKTSPTPLPSLLDRTSTRINLVLSEHTPRPAALRCSNNRSCLTFRFANCRSGSKSRSDSWPLSGGRLGLICSCAALQALCCTRCGAGKEGHRRREKRPAASYRDEGRETITPELVPVPKTGWAYP